MPDKNSRDDENAKTLARREKTRQEKTSADKELHRPTTILSPKDLQALEEQAGVDEPIMQSDLSIERKTKIVERQIEESDRISDTYFQKLGEVSFQWSQSASIGSEGMTRGHSSLAPPVAERPSILSFLASVPDLATSVKTLVVDDSDEELGKADEAPGESTLKYGKLGDIAEGGMGRVVLAKDRDLNRLVAMKTLHKNLSTSPTNIGRFLSEAQATGQLEHPNIVPIHDVGINAQGEVYFTMKYVRGETIADIIAKLKSGDKQYHREYTFSRRMQIIQGICDAIAFAHSKGIIHRDLKPANIMLGRFGEVMVMDWGLAKKIRCGNDSDRKAAEEGSTSAIQRLAEAAQKIHDESGMTTEDGSIIGTPLYMSPEQARGEIDAIDERSDIYSIGAIIYEFMTFRTPTGGKGIRQILKNVLEKKPVAMKKIKRARQGAIPIEIDYIVQRALKKEPDDRYQTVNALSEEIELYLEGRYPIVCPHTAAKRFFYGLARATDDYNKIFMLLMALMVSTPIIVAVLYFSGLLPV